MSTQTLIPEYDNETIKPPSKLVYEHEETLQRLLKRACTEYPIEHNQNFTNHLSQGLIALAKLNASEAQLLNFFHTYVKMYFKIEKGIPSKKRINHENFDQFIGKKIHYLDYVDFFRDEIEEIGLKETLGKYIPKFSSSISAAAFHCIIQTGYGLEIKNDQTIAEGLAFFCFSFKELIDPKFDKVDTFHPFNIPWIINCFKELRKSSKIRTLYSNPEFPSMLFATKLELIRDKLLDLSKNCLGDQITPNLPTIDFPLHLKENELDDIMNHIVYFSFYLFGTTGAEDFFLLHGISATRSARNAFPYIQSREEKGIFLRHLWRGLVFVYIAQGMPQPHCISESFNYETYNLAKERNECPWGKLAERCFSSHEEHIVKLVFMCKEEEEYYEQYKDGLPIEFGKEILYLACEKALSRVGLHGEKFNFHGVGFYLLSRL